MRGQISQNLFLNKIAKKFPKTNSNRNNIRAVFPKNYIGAENFVLVQNRLDHLLVAVGQRHCVGEFEAATGFPFEINVRPLLVQPNTDCFKLLLEQFLLLIFLEIKKWFLI